MTAVYALIPAAGRGARFNTDGAADGDSKVFAMLGGQTVLRRTVSAFAEHGRIDGIIVMAGAGDVTRCREALLGVGKVLAVVAGGATRQDSVGIGLYALGAAPDDIVLVHDGARPLVTALLIDRCLDAVQAYGSAVAALPVTDTLKSTRTHPAAPDAPTVLGDISREGLWAVQTPQAFRAQTLLNAHVAARAEGFSGTDEASLVQHLEDVPVHLVMGSPDNLKVTHPHDLAFAEALLAARAPSSQISPMSQEMRIGFGYDIHRLVSGRALMLGGVAVPDPQGRGLDGHSDADVLLHALCDALLGAAGLPDIGNLYPNTDPAYKNIRSLELLADVRSRIADAGFAVVNADLTLIAEAPKIAPSVPQMRAAIADALGIEPSRVGIKATTNEGLGALGAGEGMAAHAVVALRLG